MGFDPTDTSDRARLSVRQVAERFIELFHNQDRLREAFECWVHEDYIQHNPYAQSGREKTLAFLENAQAQFPRLHHDVKRVVFGDGDLVAVHYNFRREPDELGTAVIDILRIEDGWVVEHWDVIQPVPRPEEQVNPIGMF